MSELEPRPSRDRWIATVWEFGALGLLLAVWGLPHSPISSDARTLLWLLSGLHLWRGLTTLGRASLPPLWLGLLEGAAVLGHLDSGAGELANRFERLLRWQGLPDAGGTLPLWCYLPALGVAGLCLWRLVKGQAVWLEPRRPSLRRLTTGLGAVALLGLPLALFAGTGSSAWSAGTEQGGIQAEEFLSWQTARSHLRSRGRARGIWASVEPPSEARAFTLRYLSEALVDVEARVLVRGQGPDRLLTTTPLLGTSPGVVRAAIEIDSETSLGPGERLHFEVHCANDPRFEGVLELAPLETLRTSFVQRSEREGWLGALATSPLCPLLLALGILHVLGTWPRLGPGCRLVAVTSLTWCGASWLVATAPQLRLPLGWLALGPATLLLGLQGWLELAPLSEVFPPAVRYGPDVYGVLQGQLAPIFPTGVISPGGTPAHLERIQARLSAVSDSIPLGVLALSVLGLAAALIWSARSGPRRPTLRASNCLFALAGLSYVIHPSWHLPIAQANQRVLAVLLVGGVFLAWRGLRFLEDRVPASTSTERWTWVDPQVLLVVGLYVLLRIPDLFNPPTLNSDEGFVWSCGTTAYAAFKFGFSRWTVLFVLSGTAVAATLFARRVRRAELWFLAGAGACLLAWALWYPATNWGEGAIFRYPPLAKLYLGAMTMIVGPSLEASRFCNLLVFGVSGYALYLSARRLGCARGAAISVMLLFLATNTIWYWSAFTYNSSYLVTCTAISCVPLSSWFRDGKPETLCWLGFALALTGASRVTGAVVFAVFFLAVCATLVVKSSHRTRGNAWGLAFMVVAVVPGVLLWQKGIASWYWSVGVPMSWKTMGSLLSTFDRWRLTPRAIMDGNGSWLMLLVAAGVLAGLATRALRRKWGGIVCVLAFWLAVVTVIPILFGRATVWDAFGRFLLPAMLPLALLAGVALDAAQRRFGRWAPLALVAPIVCWHLGVVGRPPKLPTDLNPYVQNYERTHIFLPDEAIEANLPEGVELKEVAFFHETFIFTRIYLHQIPFPLPKTLDELYGVMREKGWRVLVLPYAPDPRLNDAVWRYQRSGPPLDPEIWQTPAALIADPRFEPAGVVTFDGVEFRLYLLGEE